MMRSFVLVYAGLVGIGASLTALAGYSVMSIVVAGWVFPSVVFSLIFLPPIAIRRLSGLGTPQGDSVVLKLIETDMGGTLSSR